VLAFGRRIVSLAMVPGAAKAFDKGQHMASTCVDGWCLEGQHVQEAPSCLKCFFAAAA